MSIEGSGPVSTIGALKSHAFDLVRAGLVRRPVENNTRDRAFATYQRAFRALMRAEPAEFSVVGSRPLATGESSRVIEVTLRTAAVVDPGDMLYLLWRNSADRVAAFKPRERALRYYTTPLAHRPARLTMANEHEVLTEVLDLSSGSRASLRASERIRPRIYTVAGVVAAGEGQSDVAIHVTLDDTWPRRAAAFLSRLEIGDAVAGWVLPHPNRLNHSVPTLAIVTGSGAAGVFAALRDGGAPIDLVWGLGDKKLEPWVLEELARHRAGGSLNSVHFARRPDRVTDVLDDLVVAPRAVYLSGNESMGEAVDAILRGRWGSDVVDQLSRDMTYIASY